MDINFAWTCPFCEKDAVITNESFQLNFIDLDLENADGPRRLYTKFIVCPDPGCQRAALGITLAEPIKDPSTSTVKHHRELKSWKLIPPSKAKVFPEYIPKVILDDYNEACLICDLSPRASAALSRRCLQGIIRDRWNVKPGRLVEEIEQIKDRVDPPAWETIDLTRKVGNIGAFMEEEANVIAEVERHEAALLINLIERLLKDWYIERKGRED